MTTHFLFLFLLVAAAAVRCAPTCNSSCDGTDWEAQPGYIEDVALPISSVFWIPFAILLLYCGIALWRILPDGRQFLERVKALCHLAVHPFELTRAVIRFMRDGTVPWPAAVPDAVFEMPNRQVNQAQVMLRETQEAFDEDVDITLTEAHEDDYNPADTRLPPSPLPLDDASVGSDQAESVHSPDETVGEALILTTSRTVLVPPPIFREPRSLWWSVRTTLRTIGRLRMRAVTPGGGDETHLRSAVQAEMEAAGQSTVVENSQGVLTQRQATIHDGSEMAVTG